MELWIRSQNRGALIKVEMLGQIDGVIYSYLGLNQTELGTYKSGERALEVLNEIQENIEKQGQEIILTNERGIPNGSKIFGYVYEMPKE